MWGSSKQQQMLLKLGETSSLSTANQSAYNHKAANAHLTCTEMVCRSWSSHRSGSHTALLPDRAASNLQQTLQPSTDHNMNEVLTQPLSVSVSSCSPIATAAASGCTP